MKKEKLISSNVFKKKKNSNIFIRKMMFLTHKIIIGAFFNQNVDFIRTFISNY